MVLYKRMTDLDLKGKRVLIREDLNVPVKNGVVVNDARLRAALPTIKEALAAGAEVILMSHLGRPEEGKPATEQPQFSLRPVADHLQQLLNHHYLKTSSGSGQRPSPQVVLVKAEDYLSGKGLSGLGPGRIALLENVRFNEGEAANSDDLAKQYAALCDVFVMDAFGTAHRAQASTHGVARYAAEACAGPLLCRELDALGRCMEDPKRPMLAIVGGAKVSSKLKVLQNLAPKVDRLIVGGGIANTFLAAAGHPVGRSLHEPELIPTARQLMQQTDIPLPTDVVVAKQAAADAESRTCPVAEVRADEMILDIGPDTVSHFAKIIAEMQTILWNGPIGVFEFNAFATGTNEIAQAVAVSGAFSIAGGGETITAIDIFLPGPTISHTTSGGEIATDTEEPNDSPSISYISTGGGAFLEYVQGAALPAVQILKKRAQTK